MKIDGYLITYHPWSKAGLYTGEVRMIIHHKGKDVMSEDL